MICTRAGEEPALFRGEAAIPNKKVHTRPVYHNVYRVVALIPRGRVASYGQVAAMVTGCTARMVGYAMSGIPEGLDLPWQRVVNSQGGISSRGEGEGMAEQRKILEMEGVCFRESGRIDMKRFRWEGPGDDWMIESGAGPFVVEPEEK